MAPALPIKFQELLQLSTVGVNQASISFNNCVRAPVLELQLPPLFANRPASSRNPPMPACISTWLCIVS